MIFLVIIVFNMMIMMIFLVIIVFKLFYLCDFIYYIFVIIFLLQSIQKQSYLLNTKNLSGFVKFDFLVPSVRLNDAVWWEEL